MCLLGPFIETRHYKLDLFTKKDHQKVKCTLELKGTLTISCLFYTLYFRGGTCSHLVFLDKDGKTVAESRTKGTNLCLLGL